MRCHLLLLFSEALVQLHFLHAVCGVLILTIVRQSFEGDNSDCVCASLQYNSNSTHYKEAGELLQQRESDQLMKMAGTALLP